MMLRWLVLTALTLLLMILSSRFLNLLSITVSLLLAVACTKTTDDPAPPPEAPTGTVEGSVTPVGSISAVDLTEPGATSGLATQVDVTGFFRFSRVPVGTYTLSFREMSGYNRPSPRTLTVVANATTSAGTTTVNSSGPSTVQARGSLTWQVAGTTYTSAVTSGTATLYNGVPGSLSVQATAQNGSTADILGLNLPNYGGPGLYRFENVMGSGHATYLRTVGGVPTGSFTTSGYVGIQGTATVTAADPMARTLSGTFGFTAYDRNGSASQGTDRISATNGTFALSY